MNTYLLNRAILNRDALDDDQRKAIFAKLRGGGGRAWGRIKEGVSEMGRLPNPVNYLDKLESEQQGRDALVRTALAFTPVGAGVAIDDLMHARKPSELAMASVGVLPIAGGAMDDLAWSAIFRRHGMDPRLRIPFGVAERGPRYTTAQQARRNTLAAELRRDRELKRMDLHPEKFFGNRLPPTDDPRERRRRAFWAKQRSGASRSMSVSSPGRGGGAAADRPIRSLWELLPPDQRPPRVAHASPPALRPGESAPGMLPLPAPIRSPVNGPGGPSRPVDRFNTEGGPGGIEGPEPWNQAGGHQHSPGAMGLERGPLSPMQQLAHDYATGSIPAQRILELWNEFNASAGALVT